MFTFWCEIFDQVIIIVINSRVEVHCTSVKHHNYRALTLKMSNYMHDVMGIDPPCIQRSRKHWDRDSLRPLSEYRCDYSDKPQSISSHREFHPIYSDLVVVSIVILLLEEKRKELTEGLNIYPVSNWHGYLDDTNCLSIPCDSLISSNWSESCPYHEFRRDNCYWQDE